MILLPMESVSFLREHKAGKCMIPCPSSRGEVNPSLATGPKVEIEGGIVRNSACSFCH